MADIAALFSTDEESTEKGAWIPIRPGLRFRIRSVHSKAVRTEETRLTRKNRGKLVQAQGILDPDDADATEVLLVARAVVTGWEGAELDGKPLDYSRGNCERLMVRFPQLRREVMMHARTDDNYRPPEAAAAELEAMAGNSSPQSDTTTA